VCNSRKGDFKIFSHCSIVSWFLFLVKAFLIFKKRFYRKKTRLVTAPRPVIELVSSNSCLLVNGKWSVDSVRKKNQFLELRTATDLKKDTLWDEHISMILEMSCLKIDKYHFPSQSIH
jgi:hypothetical protein